MRTVVSTSTASGRATARASHVAVRTCIGCRGREAATELLRVVVAPDATGDKTADHRGDTASTQVDAGSAVAASRVVPDPRRRMPGRGAWLHRDPGCVDLAQRRRAFGRALRVPGLIDPAAVVEFVAAHYAVDQHHPHITSGTPQETKS